MDHTEEVALLLFGMGEETAAKVMQHMTKKQVEKVIVAMKELHAVDQDKVTRILDKFFNQTSKKAVADRTPETYIADTLVKAVGSQRAETMLDKEKITPRPAGMEDLNWQPDFVVADMIRFEHPQVIAVVLSNLDRDKAARILKLMPKSSQADILERICETGPLSPIALSEMERILSEQLKNTIVFKESILGGVDASAEIINFLDSDLESSVINEIKSNNENLYRMIQEKIFPFEHLASLSAEHLKILIASTSQKTLAYALKGADDEFQALIFSNMEELRREALKSEMIRIGFVQLIKVQEAQKQMVMLAHQLAQKNKISIPPRRR